MNTSREVLLLIESSNGYGRELLRGIRDWNARHAGWSLRFVEQGRGAGVPEWLPNWRGHGIIARVETEDIARDLRASRKPVVDVSAALKSPVFPQVVTDSRSATELAFEHLRERGHTHFAFLGDARFNWSLKREEYFRQHALSAGFACHTHSARSVESSAGATRLQKWIRGLPKPVGILACYDLLGHALLEACSIAGIDVPDTASVIGIHNDELLCELCAPPLTSVAPNARRAGYVAAERLSALMNRERGTPELTEIAPLGVVTRQSTDAIAVPDTKIAAAVRFIREQATAGIQVEDVLRKVPMARTTLERKFQRFLHRSPRQYIERVRIQHVQQRLAGTNQSIAQIAEAAGFSSPEYMSSAFSRATGESPSAWRKRMST